MKFLARVLVFVLVAGASFAQDTGKVFVVRHAEKQSDDKDSPLNEKGFARAQCLAQTLKEAHVTAVFTTNYRRTKQTAAPLAELTHAKQTVIDDNPGTVEQARAAAKTGNVLIVGHSNTVPKLLLAFGTPPITIPDDVFDQLFIFDAANPKELIVLHYCPNLPKDATPHAPNSMAKPK